MNHKNIKLSVMLLGISIAVHAQQATNTAGGVATGNGGTVSYSVGQVVYSTYKGTSGSVIQGVQQPYEIFIVTGTEYQQLSLSIKAYPNPTADYLQLEIENIDFQNLSFQLLNISGNLIHSKNITTNNETIIMKDLSSGSYYLKIINDIKEIKTYKIIKH